MTNINLAIHIAGPTWAWIALCVMAGISTTLYAVKIGLDLWIHFAKRKAFDAIAAFARNKPQ